MEKPAMPFHDLSFRVQRDPVRDGLNLWIIDQGFSGQAFATEIVFRAVGEGELIPEPVLSLTEHDVQMLMDTLYKAGIRPTEAGAEGELSAVRYHLEDLRSLIFAGKRK